MVRWRNWLVYSLIAALLLAPLQAFAAPSGAQGDTAAYVRFKDDWKGKYLYEDSAGKVRYGTTALSDASAQWRIEDAGGGKKLIRNRASGHVLDMTSATPDARMTDPLEATGADASRPGALWLVSDVAGKPGAVSVTSPDYAGRLLNVQSQDGYAHVNNWAQPGWGSAVWHLEAADAAEPVRLLNSWQGTYLYEDAGQVKYGKPALTDASSQWFAETVDGKTAFRNRASGHFLNMKNVFASENVTQPLEALPWEDGEAAVAALWQLSPPNAAGEISVASTVYADRLLNVQSQDGYAHANNWAQATWGSALWKLDIAADTAPVRLKDGWKGGYLYEDEAGAVKYGIPEDGADKSAQWLVYDAADGTLIRNLQSGRYLQPGEPAATASAPAAWNKAAAKDSGGSSVDGHFTFASPADASALLNVQAQDGAGHVNDWAQATWGSAQWSLEDPAAPIGGGEDPKPSYIRIKNDWLQLYLFEEGGIVKYGNAAVGDPKAEWLIVSGDGFKRIQNRATGHFITLEGVTDARQALKASALAEGSDAGDWIIEDYGVNKEIHSARDRNDVPGSQLYIHVENKLKFAQYGVIDRTYGSPQWTFVPVEETGLPQGYVTLKNGYRGSYLYEKDGIVKDGQPDLGDAAAHWALRQGQQGVMIVNRATGHRISNEHVTSYESALEALAVDPSYASAQWTVTDGPDGTLVFTNVWKNDQRIHDEDNRGFAQSSDVPADWGSAQWLPEAAPSIPAALPEGYVRIKNGATGQYLYENGRQAVLYGARPESDASSHWRILDGADGMRIENRATGRVLSIAGGKAYAATEAAGSASNDSLWHVEEAVVAGSYLIRSGAAGHEDEYLHTEDRAGYAQYDLRSVESPGVRWTLEAAPAEAVQPERENEDVNGVTPAITDANVYALVNAGGGRLTADGDGVRAAAVGSNGGEQSQWLAEAYNGYTRFKAKATGRYLTASADGAIGLAADGTALGAQWRVAADAGLVTLTSALLPSRQLAAEGAAGGLRLADGALPAARWAMTPLRGTVAYEAENAFARGGMQLAAADGVSYADGFEGPDAALFFAVDAPAASSYAAAIRYRGDGELALVVNGVQVQKLVLHGSAEWSEVQATLPLRAGYNSVALAGDGAASGEVAVDKLIVRGSTAPAARGADLPYTTYEAEGMATNGQLVSGSRIYGTLSAESSGRQAVTLAAEGDYVSFKTAAAANFLNLRYSIPDSADGAGQDATLSLYVNGQKRGTLALTSKFGWVYGKYPYSNNPADGDAHRFYDEAQQPVGDISAGATVMLRKDAGDTAASYTIDFAELELAPDALSMPAGYVSALQYGAVPDDGEDDTAALKSAIAAAREGGFGLWLPAGTYRLSGGPLEVSGVTIAGAGMWHTKLAGAGFMGSGDRVNVRDLTVDVGVNARRDALSEAAFDGAFGSGSSIMNVWIRHAKAGVWTTLSDDGTLNTEGLYVGGLRVRDTYADGVHFSTGTKHSMLEHSSIRNTGDDAVALWSDPRQGVSDERARTEGNVIRFNTIQLPALADNVAVFGGKDNAIRDNVIADTMGFGAGIAVSTRFNPVPFSGTTVVERNTLLRTGGREPNWNQDFGAIWLFAGDKPIDADIVIRNNEAIDSTYQGFYTNGDKSVLAGDGRKVRVENLVIDGAGTWGLHVNSDARGSVTLANVLVRGTKLGRTFNGAGVDKFVWEAGTAEDADAAAGLNPQTVPDAQDVVTNPPGQPPASGGGGPTPAVQSLDEAVRKALAGKPSTAIVIDAAASESGAVQVSFGADVLKAAVAALPAGRLEVRAGKVSYKLPLALVAQWLSDAGTEGRLELSISPVAGDTLAAMQTAAKAGGLSLIEGTNYEFKLGWRTEGQFKPLERFGSVYVDRVLMVDRMLDAARTAALVYDPASGGFRPVPALIETVDGGTAVTIRSTTNSIYVLASSAPTFGDMAAHWAKADTELLAAKRIVNGTGGGRFAPGMSVTRAEFAAMLVRALGLTADGGAAPFKDVESGAWYAADTAAAAQYGLVQGLGGGLFGPRAQVTREQMAVMLAAALKLAPAAADGATTPAAGGEAAPATTAAADAGFADAAQITAWAKDAAETLRRQGLLQGRAGGVFDPKAAVTRAEAAAALKRLLQAANLLNR
ncbi:RICIN domain-containing protein [Cohnella sp. 56]|uniref:RICIN domain-containing protein n=1 Tax=Cohnella sp. 56 TaxID=3113722 RepID=UPI0030E82EBD